jgi:glycosyltransferase involved in cell wall biosynthesis
MCFISIPGSDATSISLLEAMSAGCIPIVSDLPANREWIINGENGIIVNDLNENFLEKAINLNADNVKRINQDLFLEKASKNINRDKFLQLYKQIMMEK